MTKEKNKILIVLTVAAAVFLLAVFLIYSGGWPAGDTDGFSVYGNEAVGFENAVVNEVIRESMETDEAAGGASSGEQELSVTVGSGQHKGSEMLVHNYFGPLSGVPVSEGDSVIITVRQSADGEYRAAVARSRGQLPRIFLFA